MKKFWENTYFKWGTTVFAVGALLVVFYHILSDFTGFREGVSKFITILSPFIYGLVMAYLLSPVYNYIVRKMYPSLKGNAKHSKRALTISKTVATVVSLLFLFGVILGMGALIIPQLVESVKGVSQTLPDNMDHFRDIINNLLANMENTALAETIQGAVDELQDGLLQWVQDIFLPGVGSLMQRVSSSVIVTIKTVLNLVIGVIACAYFLNGKERFLAQSKKTVLAFMQREKADELIEFASYSNKTFGGFVTGKIIDSLIIGIICFIAMTVIKLPYPVLISTIVGVTNIIPFFGPFIGAIPSLALIILISPIQALWFLILVILLQQLDGNVIGPAILGNSVGIASFWVMFAIIIGGGLFGFIGMVLGVPVFAVIYHYMGKVLKKNLRKKDLPLETENYVQLDKYKIEKSEIYDEETK